MTRTEILPLRATLVPDIQQRLDVRSTVHRQFGPVDHGVPVSACSARMQAAVKGGHTGIRKVWPGSVPNLKAATFGGVGANAVGLGCCSSRGLRAGSRFTCSTDWERVLRPGAIQLTRPLLGQMVPGSPAHARAAGRPNLNLTS